MKRVWEEQGAKGKEKKRKARKDRKRKIKKKRNIDKIYSSWVHSHDLLNLNILQL